MRAFPKTLGALTLLLSITAFGMMSASRAFGQGEVPVPEPSPTPPSTPVPETDIVTVNIVGIAFSPQLLTIKAGQTVRWVNTSGFAHTVTTDPTLARNPANASVPEGVTPWHSGNIAAGESFSIQLTVPGEYKYFCKPHEVMGHVGTIIVE